MDEKRLFNTDEAVQFVWDPGSDSDLLDLSEGKDEEITMKDIPARIGHRKKINQCRHMGNAWVSP